MSLSSASGYPQPVGCYTLHSVNTADRPYLVLLHYLPYHSRQNIPRPNTDIPDRCLQKGVNTMQLPKKRDTYQCCLIQNSGLVFPKRIVLSAPCVSMASMGSELVDVGRTGGEGHRT